jgi:1,4-alpha-glucan branching enzyme
MNQYKRKREPVASHNADPPASETARPVQEKVDIALTLSAKEANSVAVGGTFNGWQSARHPLSKGFDGVWRTRLSLAPGRYEYRFVVDGKWIEDPLAKESVRNPYGGNNSVLVVEVPSVKSAYAGAW